MSTVSTVPLNLLLNLAPTLLPHPSLHLTLTSNLPKNLTQPPGVLRINQPRALAPWALRACRSHRIVGTGCAYLGAVSEITPDLRP